MAEMTRSYPNTEEDMTGINCPSSHHYNFCTYAAQFGDTYFLIASRKLIARVSLNGRQHQVLVNDLTNAVAIDYDYR